MSTRRKRIVLWSSVVLLVALLGVKTFLIDFYRIPQNGMYPGLPAGSRLLVNYRAYSGPSSVKRGDIVVFVREEDGRRYNLIWRVVALPGDHVATAGEGLMINGEMVGRKRVREVDGSIVYQERNGDASYEVAFHPSPRHPPPEVALTVPEGHFFVMGDNRMDARDSRQFGPIPFGAIVGRKQ